MPLTDRHGLWRQTGARAMISTRRPVAIRQLSASIAISPPAFQDQRAAPPQRRISDANWKLNYWHNLAAYILPGGAGSSKGDALIASYSKPLIYDPPRQLDLCWLGRGLFWP